LGQYQSTQDIIKRTKNMIFTEQIKENFKDHIAMFSEYNNENSYFKSYKMIKFLSRVETASFYHLN